MAAANPQKISLVTFERLVRLTAAITPSMNRQHKLPLDFSPYSREAIRVAVTGSQGTTRGGFRLNS
jgi:hypothetical protein